jgi:putative transcriptional regulator
MLSEAERDAVITGIALAPEGGDLIPQGASTDEDETMKKNRFDRLVASLGEVRDHVATGRFTGRISKVEVGASDIRAVRERSGMTQRQFAATFGIGLGTLQKWEQGERRPSGAAKSLLKVMQADLPAVVRALDVVPPRRGRRPKQARRAA